MNLCLSRRIGTREEDIDRKLVVKVVNIEGKCPVYKVGEKIVLDEGYRVNLEESDNICMHSLASIMPYYVALYNGVSPKNLGLANKEGKACVHCLDPCELTGGGTVIFEVIIEGD